jgi:4-amino-4-deoxy-L-arabinose transferase-like glycosyltransferase
MSNEAPPLSPLSEQAAANGSVRTRLTWILLVGAALRIGLVWNFGAAAPVITDAKDYDRLATRLVETGGYVDERGQLTSLRPPLFPAIAAQIYEWFGVHNYQAVAVFQAAVSLATVWLTFRLAAELYSPSIGLGAAAIVCFYPTLLAYNQFFLSEVLFTFFVTAGALLTLRIARTAGGVEAALLGLCLGLGALTRSVLWLFAPVLVVAVMVLGQAARPKRAVAAAATLLVFAAVIAPWAWRNTRLQGTLTFVDVMGGRNVMMGNYEYTPLERSWATIESQTGERAWYYVLAMNTPDYGQMSQGEVDKAAMKYGVQYFFTHPGQSLLRSTVKFFNYWQLEREIVAAVRQGLFGEASVATAAVVGLIVCGAYAATIFGAVFGVFVTPPAQRRDLWLLLVWIAFPCAIHTVAFAHSRYHLPFVPILAAFAAAAFSQWRTVLAARGGWSFRVACGVCLVLAASWIREFVIVDAKWFM